MADAPYLGPPMSDMTDAALRTAVDAAPDGILVVDEAGKIIFVNPMAEQLFEYERDELVGESVDRLLPDAARGTHAARRAAYMDRPRPRPMGSGLELLGRQRSGTVFPVEISLSPVRSGGQSLVIAVVRDVTDRREADEELTRAREALSLGDERERIARDLHDTVIQRMFAVGLSLQAIVTRAGDDPALERINQAIDDIDETIRDLRSTIFALHSRRAGTAGVRDAVIAISTLREALSNVARHAHATRTEVEVSIQNGFLALCVRDNGAGLGDQPEAGNGLANISDRAQELGGTCSLTSPGSGGTIVEWRVPINKPNDER